MEMRTESAKLRWLRNANRFFPVFTLVALLLLLLLTAGGCTRNFFRNAADREVNDILAEKDKYGDWKIEQFHVYPDPRARFADPTDPDHPPMPPDDEAAWKLAPHPQYPGCEGVGTVQGTAYLEMIKTWDEQNRKERTTTEEAEKKEAGPQTDSEFGPREPIKTYFDEPLTAKRRGFLLKLDQSVELGVINSPTYQTFREQLYEEALPVTLQRFSFAYQWTLMEDAIRKWAGVDAVGGHQNNWTLNSSASFTKMFSTGALLTFDFANNTVFNFLGNGPHFNTASTINLNLVQPLLKGGGKAVNLEPLTQAERNLLYAIRAYARFREQFFVGVALGTNLPGSLIVASGASVSGSPISVLAALGIASTDVSGGFVGYLSTLFRECDEAADKKWVRDLGEALKIFEGYQEGGLFSPLQVDQVRSQLLNATNTVLVDQQNVNNALDQFKLLLGLPANLPLILDDTPARPITRQFDRYYEVLADADAAAKLVERQEELAPEKLRALLLEIYTNHRLVQGTEFQKKIRPIWEGWTRLKDKEVKERLETLRLERRKLLDLKTDLELKGQTLSEADQARLSQAEFESDVGSLEEVLREYEKRPWEKLAKEEQRRLDRTKKFRLVAYDAEVVLVWARNERFNAVFKLWPEAPGAPLGDIDLLTADAYVAQEEAVKAALSSRWDLMNARAQLVDAWRQLRVTANALMGVFNVQYNLTSTTPPIGTRPFAFSSSRTIEQLSFNAQLPLVRIPERNAYRTALIIYQQARRSLMSLEDSIASQVRFDVRQLQLFFANYKIQKKVVQSLYSQVENALELIVAPTDPDQLKATGTAGAANAAALTNQYLSALSGLNGSQTKMYDIWLSLLGTRMQLYLDLERLPLDLRGVWIDESGNPSNAGGNPAGCADPGQPAATSQRPGPDEGALPVAPAAALEQATQGPDH
jgi:hypothetical protein